MTKRIWSVKYEANRLPHQDEPVNQRWTRTIGGAGPTTEVINTDNERRVLHTKTAFGNTITYVRTFDEPSSFTFVFGTRAINALPDGISLQGALFGTGNWWSFNTSGGNKVFSFNAAGNLPLVDWTVYHMYRLTFLKRGTTWDIDFYLDEEMYPRSGARNTAQGGALLDDVGFSETGINGENFLDFFYYSEFGAFSPGDLPLGACAEDDISITSLIKPCILPARIPAVI